MEKRNINLALSSQFDLTSSRTPYEWDIPRTLDTAFEDVYQQPRCVCRLPCNTMTSRQPCRMLASAETLPFELFIEPPC